MPTQMIGESSPTSDIAAATGTMEAPGPPAGGSAIARGGLGRAFYPKLLSGVGRLPFRDGQANGPAAAFQACFTRGWYAYLNAADRRSKMLFMNYGYAASPGEPPVPLDEADEKDRYCIQLYHRVAAAVDLRGREVIEVGCGRGGGASYVARALGPRALVGIDYTRAAVEFCRRRHRRDGLSFEQGDAADLPRPDASCDAVLNVESSHCYPAMDRFLAEAGRVLRPGGHLLFADMRHRSGLPRLRDQFRRSGLVVEEAQEITANVLLALELDSDRKLGLIRAYCPAIIRPMFRCFAGLRGTPSYEAFASGEWVYWRFVLRKAA